MKLNRMIKQLPILGISISFQAAWASSASEQVAQHLQTLYPQTHFNSVSETPLNGIYEVTMGNNIAYVQEDGRYFIFGALYDMQSQKDLTAQSRNKLSAAQFSELPFANAITVKKGNGGKKQREFALFTDPDCPFCQRLEETLAGMTNYTVHIFLYPIDSLHPNAGKQAERIWCSRNQKQAWNDYMLSGIVPSDKTCANPIGDNIVLAQQLGIRGTPTMLHIDGRRTSGAMPRINLERWLNGEE